MEWDRGLGLVLVYMQLTMYQDFTLLYLYISLKINQNNLNIDNDDLIMHCNLHFDAHNDMICCFWKMQVHVDFWFVYSALFLKV